MSKFLFALFVLLLLQACAEAPNRVQQNLSAGYSEQGWSRFSAHGDIVFDKATDLYWKRCFEGEKWDGKNCADFADIDSWRGAKAREANSGGWRLPTKAELLSISGTYALPIWGEKPRPDHMIWSSDDAVETYYGVVLSKKWMVSNKRNYVKQGRTDANFDSALIRLVCGGKTHKSRMQESNCQRKIS